MIAPLCGLGIKGIVWYQGEFNASDADQYGRLLPMMITTWRKGWNDDLPFVVIQLPNVNQTVTYPTESPWARLREAQLKALGLAKTAVTVTLDTGDGELHPKTKRKLGERAALSALQLAYGKNINAEAPLYTGYKMENNRIRIFFKNIQGGFTVKNNGPLVGFTIAGGNYRFVNAQAKLDTNNSVLVWNNDISVPVAVRYAWAQNPVLSLYNQAGLPVSSFRTDHWPADMKDYKEDTAKKAVLNRLLSPDYASAPLKDWEQQYNVFQFKVYEKDEHVLPYRFYQPVAESGKKYPLVLLMHGAGERGFDNRLQLSRLKGLPFWEKDPCFVIAPQCPERPADNTDGESVWVKTSFGVPSHTMQDKPTWPMQMTMELLKKIIADNPIDPDHIYVTGLSMGGFATWELIQRMPDLFAAAIPVCGGGDTALAGKLVHIPLWVFHGGADPTVMVQRSRDMVKCITDAGGHPKYTEYPGVGHNAWSQTYNNPEVWNWLFAQKKEKN
jgi:poly(3-hydroxybutyrate) depolymerase